MFHRQNPSRSGHVESPRPSMHPTRLVFRARCYDGRCATAFGGVLPAVVTSEGTLIRRVKPTPGTLFGGVLNGLTPQRQGTTKIVKDGVYDLFHLLCMPSAELLKVARL